MASVQPPVTPVLEGDNPIDALLSAHGLRRLRGKQTKEDAGDNAQKHPERQVALEKPQRGICGLLADHFTRAGHWGFLTVERPV